MTHSGTDYVNLISNSSGLFAYGGLEVFGQGVAAGSPVAYIHGGLSLFSGGTTSGTANKLIGLAAGGVNAGSTDAINGGQLFNSNQAIATAFGTTLDASGNQVAPSYTLSNANTIAGTTVRRATWAGASARSMRRWASSTPRSPTSTTTAPATSRPGGLKDGTDDAVAIALRSPPAQVQRPPAVFPHTTPRRTTTPWPSEAAPSPPVVVPLPSATRPMPIFTNVAIGAGADASGSGRRSMALGINSKATASDAVALGASSVADRDNTVSVVRAPRSAR
jgi:hypothetical protein